MLSVLTLSLVLTPAPQAALQPGEVHSMRHVWADLDADGRLDLLLLGTEDGDSLLRNAGEGRFEDVTRESGLGRHASMSHALEDFDGDGESDLFLLGIDGRARLYRAASGAFEDASYLLAGAAGFRAGAAQWLDLDGDEWTDLVLEGADGTRLLVLRNLAGRAFEPLELRGAAPAVRVVEVPQEDGAPGEPPAEDGEPLAEPRPEGGGEVAGRPGPGPRSVRTEVVLTGAPAAPEPYVISAIDGTLCVASLIDAANPGTCISASTTATLGMLYPLSSDLFVDTAGYVGMGTTTPAARLHVEGQAVFGEGSIATGSKAAVLGGATNTAAGSHATVAGGLQNTAGGSFAGVGNGYQNDSSGAYSFTAGVQNVASSSYCVVSGGIQNDATDIAATVSGGQLNEASGNSSVVAGGTSNTASNTYATVGGGNNNVASGLTSTIAGGSSNTADSLATVGGGSGNDATGMRSTIAGGLGNSASGTSAAIGGGSSNNASGEYSAVPGGDRNTASGDFAFAGGRKAQALHTGSFVWADSEGDDPGGGTVFASTGLDQFLVRAGGGVGINTNAPGAALEVDAAKAVDPLVVRADTSMRFKVTSGGTVAVGADFTPSYDLELSSSAPNGGTAGKPGGGSWTSTSDRRLKKDVRALESSLARLLALRGVTFEYIDPDAVNELDGVRTGMIAQEVREVFPDWVEAGPDGYLRLTFRGFEALAVEALRELRAEKDEELEALRGELGELRAELEAMKALR